jgi:sulfite reductase alpha subunit-like flavoprotein
MTEDGASRIALVLYGTETGTAQDLAEEVVRTLERLHFDTDVLGLNHVDHHQLHAYTLIVFVVATTGQGDFPDNARRFWTSLLRRKLSSTTLNGIDYAMVGLGDSSYPKFNWAARKLEKRITQLGATAIIESCEADEQGDEGTDGAFLAWLQNFRYIVSKVFPLPQDQLPITNDVLLPSKWQLERLAPESNIQPNTNGQSQTPPDSNGVVDSFSVTLDVNERVTPSEHWQDVRFMSLISTRPVEYMPGDAIAISPRNMSEDVNTLLHRMNWQDLADIPLRLVSTRNHDGSHASFAPPLSKTNGLTIRKLLTEHLDINAIPRRSFLAHIANYTCDTMHRDRLLEFTDPQYLDEYYDYATRPRRSILEILQEFDSVQIPWQEITNVFPPMRPRQFSIASGGRLKNTPNGTTQFELLVAIVKYKTVIKRIRQGVCTRYLAQLPVGTELKVSLKTECRFAKPTELGNTPHLLIGAGTGIAPLRSVIHEKSTGTDGLGATVLFFGCRNEQSDYFFRDEWEATQTRSSGLFEVITAFSRDQKSKVYVQDRIRQKSALVWEYLVERQATIIVCGSSGQMPKAVRQALVDALTAQAKMRKRPEFVIGRAISDAEDEDVIEDVENAEKYLAKLEKIGRYKQETWS